MAESWVVNDKNKLAAYVSHVTAMFDKHKYLTFATPRIGADRSLDQNALLHVWLTEFAAHIAGCHKRLVTEPMLEDMKRSAKRFCYLDKRYPWLVRSATCPFTGEQKRDYSSSKSWKRGEMFLFLEWLQMFAAVRGCILEAKGEFEKLKKEQDQ